MDRAERAGLGVALVAHAGLLVLMSLNLMSVRPKPPMSEPMDVMLVDKVALRSAAPNPATEAPQAAEAPEVGPVEDASPPPEVKPTPTPPAPKPTPAPAPSPKPAPKPAPTPPAPAKPEPPKPAKAAPAKEPPAKPALEKPVKGKPKASALGDDFLKGIPAQKSPAKGTAPKAAVMDAAAASSLAALIQAQVKPCYTTPSGGTDNQGIVTRLSLRMRPDGSLAAPPEVLGQLGVTPTNQPYARQMAEAASRAVQRCAPLKLPAELYDIENGWKLFTLRFNPRNMN
jgi:outer membrane biosynthesis protein TonB